MSYHTNNYDPGQICLKPQLQKKLKLIFASPSKRSNDKKKRQAKKFIKT